MIKIMKNNYEKGISSTVLVLILAILATCGLYLWSVNSNQSSQVKDKKVVVSKKTDTTKEDPIDYSIPDYNSNLPAGLRKAFSLFKNGEIEECTLNGETYYSGGINAYDGGSEILDIKGNIVGECRGITGLCTGVLPQSCQRVYAIYPNIWGYPSINKYNLR